MKPTILTLTKYELKPEQPRVRARIQKVLEFLKPYLLRSTPSWINSAELTKVFGNQNSPQAQRLRAMLLIQSGTYIPGTRPYSYTVKRDGYEKLAAMIGMPMATDVQVARDLYGDIVSGAVEPKYTEPTKGARRYHPIQNLPKKLRGSLFTGWIDYDIQSAAPTLVYQLACKTYQKWNPTKTEVPYPSIRRLVEDRAAIRQHVVDVGGVDIGTAKGVLVALFFGAKLVPHEKQAIFRLLGGDRDVLQRLKADKFLTAFRIEVSHMWNLLMIDENSRNGMATFRTGVLIPKAATKAKQKMALYLGLERRVMDAVELHLRAQGVVPVLIHDGFMVRTSIDKEQLEQVVFTQTGFKVLFSEADIGTGTENLGDRVSEEFMESLENE